MKNVLLSLSIAFLLLNGAGASAQIVTENGKDTAMGAYAGGVGSVEVDNFIKAASDSVIMKWSVIASSTTFGPGWDMVGSGICDNNQCYTAIGATNNLFNNSASYTSGVYNNSNFTGGTHDFHVIFSATNPPAGSSAVVRINARDMVKGSSRTLTFIAYRGSTTGITTVNSTDDITLYPNPAREAVNVVYDDKAGVKTIAVFNMIGKLIGPIYKPASNGSARIDLDDNMPTGIYFLRLMDGQGHTVATRRFTRQ